MRHDSQDGYLPSINHLFFHELVHSLFAIEDLVIQLKALQYPLFGYGVARHKAKRYEQLQDEFRRLMDWVPTIETMYWDANFSIQIQAFLYGLNNYLYEIDDGRDISSQELNNCVDRIRWYLARTEVRRCSYSFQEKYRNQEIKIHQFIDRLFDSRGRVLVLRLDFSYRKGCMPSLLRIKSDRDKLSHFLREQKQGFLGLMWRIEYGIDKGYPLHTVILLNGNEVQRDVFHAESIGEHWRSVITKQDGLYFNCNAKKASYRDCGIGDIHWSNTIKRESFKRAALYLAKPDTLLEIARPLEAAYFTELGAHELAKEISGSRVFGLSELDDGKRIRSGRPRRC